MVIVLSLGTEKHTRKEIIDKRLSEAGWSVSDRTQVIEEYDIEVGLPDGVTEPQTKYHGRQFSDYSLLGKGGKLEPPFTQVHPRGILGVFAPKEIEEIMAVIQKLAA